MNDVNIIVPIYNQRDLLEKCVESVLAAKVDTIFRLKLIDDASTDPKLAEALKRFEKDSRVCVIRNEINLGFTRTVNRGLLKAEVAHPLLLNSDTVVYDHWLDVLMDALKSSDRIATVNPITNQSGSHVSCYPHPRWSAENCRKLSDRDLAQIALDVAPALTCPVPTCVGFCMLINRDCLVELGNLDQVNFPRGYGEESDFCYRARYLGWTHLVAGGAFVTHLYGKSFGDEKQSLMAELIPRFRQLHPSQESTDAEFRASDPLLFLRRRLDLGRAKFRLRGRNGIVATRKMESPNDGEPYLLVDARNSTMMSLCEPGKEKAYPNVAPYLLPGDVIGMLHDLAIAGVSRIEFQETPDMAARWVDQIKNLAPIRSSCHVEAGSMIFEGF